jgi:hypothetical protein
MLAKRKVIYPEQLPPAAGSVGDICRIGPLSELFSEQREIVLDTILTIPACTILH